MQRRKLGNSGLTIPPIAFGGNVFGWTVDEPASFHLLDAWLEAGFNFIDTADVYSKWAPGNRGGESETILGRWMQKKHNRSQVIIATKVGSEMGPGRKGLSRAYILQAAEATLKRLQTDYIDLYQAHLDDLLTPLEETLGAFAELMKAGKIRAIGASNYHAGRLAQALQSSRQRQYPQYESLQPLYNLYDRAEFETELQPVCLENNLGVICYFSLASGFLTGKYRSARDLTGRARADMVRKYMNHRGYRILEALDRVAREHHANPAQVSLAWLLTRPAVTAPIASATNLEQMKDLMAAAELRLGTGELQLLDEASR